MLLRISLIVAILAGLGAGVVSYLEVSDKIPVLTKQRDDEHTAKVNEIAAHTKTKTELKKTQVELASTQQELSDTKADRDKAVARADSQTKRADELTDKLGKVTQERDDAQNSQRRPLRSLRRQRRENYFVAQGGQAASPLR
jgi:septal ring factor EnvC (AmiA/AmiB activator)